MKIIVCVKQVPATNEVRMDPVTNTIIREGVESILNPFDAFAMEEALRLRERHGGCEIITISMGIPSVRGILQETIALGADQAFLLSDRAFAGADTLATAHALAAGINKLGAADLYICGKMATDGDTAQVGPMLAEMLGVAHATDIAEIEQVSDSELLCRKLTDDGYVRIRVQLPAVITVSKEINVPRLPSISGVLRGLAADIPVFTADDVAVDKAQIGLSGSPTQVIKTFVPDLTQHIEWIEGKPAEQAAELLEKLVARRAIIR
ncbi:MAG: electron transfer flavoprotein subunit beta/FixA family protein [Bacillota bacterium]|nr:electron transfer flavoprotein subunit beta/FixA family protein [Bacillota bacterium]